MRTPSILLRNDGVTGSGAFFDAHKVIDLVDQTAHLRAVFQLAHVVELVQTERLHAQTMPPLAAVHALEQTHADRARLVRFCFSLGHNRLPLPLSCRAWRRCARAWPSPAGP